jgi:hypothetical protein
MENIKNTADKGGDVYITLYSDGFFLIDYTK